MDGKSSCPKYRAKLLAHTNIDKAGSLQLKSVRYANLAHVRWSNLSDADLCFGISCDSFSSIWD